MWADNLLEVIFESGIQRFASDPSSNVGERSPVVSVAVGDGADAPAPEELYHFDGNITDGEFGQSVGKNVKVFA